MPMKSETFDLPSRLKTVETWERIHTALQHNPTAVLTIDNATSNVAQSTIHALHRIRVALRKQNPKEAEKYEYITIHRDGARVIIRDRYHTVADLVVKDAAGKVI